MERMEEEAIGGKQHTTWYMVPASSSLLLPVSAREEDHIDIETRKKE